MIADEPILPAAGKGSVAWRYGRKSWNREIWRYVSEMPTFETPDDWIVEPWADGNEAGGSPPEAIGGDEWKRLCALNEAVGERNKKRIASGLSVEWEQYGDIRVFRDESATIYRISGQVHVVPRSENSGFDLLDLRGLTNEKLHDLVSGKLISERMNMRNQCADANERIRSEMMETSRKRENDKLYDPCGFTRQTDSDATAFNAMPRYFQGDAWEPKL